MNIKKKNTYITFKKRFHLLISERESMSTEGEGRERRHRLPTEQRAQSRARPEPRQMLN